LYNASAPYELVRTIRNPTPESWDRFGSRMATVGNLLLIAASADNTGGDNSGAAYLYDPSTGELLHTFVNPTPQAGDAFGLHVAATADKILISARGDDTGATDSGAAYLFDAATGQLLQTFLNPTPDAGDLFGRSVAISDTK